jgi:hypothetical protein
MDMDNSLKEVRSIFHHDKNEIIKKYSATGAGIGKKGVEYVIVIYLDKKVNLENKEKKHWKNIPIELKYIGKIKIQ